MKTIITIRGIKQRTNQIMDALDPNTGTTAGGHIGRDPEAARSIREDMYRDVLKQIAFGISKDDKALAFEALRAETLDYNWK